jgi:hypothetical protein
LGGVLEFANRASNAPRADSSNWCYGVAIADGRLIVADAGKPRARLERDQ